MIEAQGKQLEMQKEEISKMNNQHEKKIAELHHVSTESERRKERERERERERKREREGKRERGDGREEGQGERDERDEQSTRE